ncbi:MAG: energy transducer TonB [Crocinitomicaceae bacterium]
MNYLTGIFFLLFSQILLAQNQGPPPPPKAANAGTIAIEEQIIEFPEVEAEFKGGMKGLQNYIAKNIRYPKEAIANNIEGKVYLAFTIDEKGKVGNIVVERGADPALDKEAIRVIRQMPKWKPGKMKNKKVKTRVRLPINFTLN